MLNISEVREEIEKLEKCDCTTQEVCKKLAILYIVRDHYIEQDIKRDSTMNAMSMPSSSMR